MPNRIKGKTRIRKNIRIRAGRRLKSRSIKFTTTKTNRKTKTLKYKSSNAFSRSMTKTSNAS